MRRVVWVVDLETRRGPYPVVHTWERETFLGFPAVSSEYAVRAESRLLPSGRSWDRTAFAIRLEAGIPVGASFPIAAGGAWLRIDGNVVFQVEIFRRILDVPRGRTGGAGRHSVTTRTFSTLPRSGFGGS